MFTSVCPPLRSLMNSGLSSPSVASHINQLSVCLINTAIVRDRPPEFNLQRGSGANETPFTAGVTGPSVCCPPSLEPLRLERGVTRLEWARRCEVGSSNKHIKRSHAEALCGERLHLKMVCVFNGGDCLRQTASAESHLMQVTSARSRMKCKAARTRCERARLQAALAVNSLWMKLSISWFTLLARASHCSAGGLGSV